MNIKNWSLTLKMGYLIMPNYDVQTDIYSQGKMIRVS